MNGLATRLRNYVRSVLHVRLELKPWNQSERLPVFLSKRYAFLHGPILSIPCVFVLVPPDSDMTPAEIGKRRDYLQGLTDDVIVFVFDRMASYNRARLIDRAVSFAVPYNQLYIPSIASRSPGAFSGTGRSRRNQPFPVYAGRVVPSSPRSRARRLDPEPAGQGSSILRDDHWARL